MESGTWFQSWLSIPCCVTLESGLVSLILNFFLYNLTSVAGRDLGRVVDTLLCGDQTNWVTAIENPSQFLAHSRCSVMACTLEFLKGTTIQDGLASSLVLRLAAWQGRGQERGTGGRMLPIACGPSGSEAWSPEGGVGGPPWSESKVISITGCV